MSENDSNVITSPGWKEAVLKGLIASAKLARKNKDSVYEELERYDRGDYPESMINWDQNISFGAKLHLTQEFKQVIGPRLYQQNPEFKVTAKPWADDISEVRAVIGEDYLNYCKGKNHLRDNIREAINDSFMAYGVVWHGIDPDNPSVVVSEHDSYKNLFLDPDAKKVRHARYAVRKRFTERFVLMKRYPTKKMELMLEPGKVRASDAECDTPDAATDMVEYYEVYLKVGLSNYKGAILDERGGEKVPDTPRKYVITENGTMLADEEWETPFHLFGEFPFSVLSYYPVTGNIYPMSPLEAGIGWQRALNWAILGLLARFYFSSRTILAIIRQNGMGLEEEDVDKLLNSESLLETIEVKAQQMGDMPVDVRQYVQQIKVSSNINEAMTVIDKLELQYQRATGLSDFLALGQPGAQDRSAAAAEIRQKNSHTRVDDMKATLDEFLSEVGRKQLLVARYHMDSEDIAKVGIGEQAAQDWGTLMAAEDRDAEKLASEFETAGVDPQQAAMLAEQLIGESVTLEQWAAELDFDIAVGSTIRRDPAQSEAAYETVMNHVLPVMMQNGDIAPAMALLGKNIIDSTGNTEIGKYIIEYGAFKEQQQQQMMQQQMAMEQQQGAEANANV